MLFLLGTVTTGLCSRYLILLTQRVHLEASNCFPDIESDETAAVKTVAKMATEKVTQHEITLVLVDIVNIIVSPKTSNH